ncbi:hypothetical protein CYMTET_40266 [Cymbomonas tetramitiformis]|uniref:Prolyl 4-hydroxylase alpha subunit Fe(2+) 2OG dioxygenase domain-containing protein n=1 Tax=Cymbomonas tetramitiformis TaxID=36881 RepID=A0AAE0C8G7_9CHLO|nr:hypothetical protein CYMTET_40266 [Cymbomonas tetramitiformis]
MGQVAAKNAVLMVFTDSPVSLYAFRRTSVTAERAERRNERGALADVVVVEGVRSTIPKYVNQRDQGRAAYTDFSTQGLRAKREELEAEIAQVKSAYQRVKAGGGQGELLGDKGPQHVLKFADFLDDAEDLRAVFDERFADPRETHNERFIWDYWHVPGQYTLIRSPAQLYFPEEQYQKLEDALLTFGQEVLGCRSLTQIWLSYYVDGCKQELHADVPHGPWAFVLSLTNWDSRQFEGGETMILQSHVLDFWRTFDAEQGLEVNDLVQFIPPEFNQMVVFDPRFPHGVRRVEGTRDPLQARLVLHGWFTEPAPFFTGGLDAESAAASLDDVLDRTYDELDKKAGAALGTLTARMDISGSTGEVTAVQLLTDTLLAHPSESDAEQVRAEILDCIFSELSKARFPVVEEDSYITIPFTFQ